MAGFCVVVTAALCGRTYRRWLLFTGVFYWQQVAFNAIGEYVGLVAERLVNIGEYTYSANAFEGCPACPTIQSRGRTARAR